ncbi:hypothetical protein L3V82_10865 [Thiotrichales bacterium 19S3-7]|nr:hypothetical protein [Thiotrichales bacterium 19S3-7]MCF6802659.1 hypothetical protein [Thiotrichales bacterium 19S3-11]
MENYDFENEALDSQTNPTSNTQQEAAEKPTKKRLEFNSSWLIYGVGAAAILFAVFILFNMGSSSKTKKAPPKPSVLEQSFTPVSKPQVQQVQVQDTSSQTMNASVAKMQLDTKNALNEVAQNLKAEAHYVSEGMKQLNDQQKQIAQQQVQMTKTIEELSKAVRDVQQGIDRANSQVKHMANLQTSLASVSQQLAMLQAERTNMADPLQLSAVMPNRAWLQNSKGSTIAVTVGSQLQGYGSITKIDSENNKVYTSSGYVFE